MSALSFAVRWRYAVITAAFLVFALVGDQANGDLEFFTQALHVLATSGSSGGLHLYAAQPSIQIGPVAILGVGILDALFFGKIVLAVVVAALALLLFTLRAIELLVLDEGIDPQRAGRALLVGGVILAASFAVAVPGWGHPDDLAALLALVVALRAARGGRGVAVGVALALGVGCKPWAAFALALVPFLPRESRRAAVAVFALGSALCWLPFVAVAPSAVAALSHYSIQSSVSSLPYQLGSASAPTWVRPGQLALSSVLLLLCVRCRRPDVAVLVVAISRLVLDAGAYPYYDAELIVGCLIADVWAAGRDNRLTCYAPLSLAAWLGMALIRAESSSPTKELVARCILYVLLLVVAAMRGAPSRATASRAVRGESHPELVVASAP